MARQILVLLAFLLFGAWAAPAGAEPFTETQLQQLLQNNPNTGRPVDSVGELIPLLPNELRENFLFVYESRSPFHAGISPEYPRVILFTHDARLVLTFIGDERQAGFDLLETMSFDDDQAKFVLRAHLMPAAERKAWRPTAEEARCPRCHGVDPRPIIDSYPLWPGFYGSVQDTFPNDRIGKKEAKNYAAFSKGAAKTGVYKDLIYRADSPVAPFLDPRLFKEDTVELDASELPVVPNARFGIALTELNRARIARKIVAGPTYAAHEKEILAKLLSCRPGERPDQKSMQAIAQQLQTENAARLKRLGIKAGDPKKSRNDMQELKFVRELAEIDWVAKRAGVDRSDWSMAREPGSLAFFDGILSGIHDGRSFYLKEDLIFELLGNLANRDPAFRPYFRFANVFEEFGYPYGHRLDLGLAIQSCAMLTNPRMSLVN